MANIVIIGNSAAGISACEVIRSKDKDSKITIVSNEDYPAYSRYMLTGFLSGEIKESQLIYRRPEFYQEFNINLLLGKKVIRVEPHRNRIVLEDSQKLEYGFLLITTGAKTKLPDIKGIHKEGILGLRFIQDAKDILAQAAIANTAVILGDDPIGLKCALVLKNKGIEVKIILNSKQISLALLEEKAGVILDEQLKSSGIEVLAEIGIAEILGEADIKAVRLSSGKIIGCQLLIVNNGFSPNVKIVEDTEVKINRGILVDESLVSSVRNIFAAGDCAEFSNDAIDSNIKSCWQEAIKQGESAGRSILNESQVKPSFIEQNENKLVG